MPERPLDLRLAIPVVALWVGAWLAPLVAPRIVLVGALVLGLALALGRRWISGLAIVAVALFLVGVTSISLRVVNLHSDPMSTWAAEHRSVNITGVVTADPEFERRQSFGSGDQLQVRVELRAERLASAGDWIDVRSPVLVVGDGDGWQDIRFGETVSLSGSLRPAPGTRPLAAFVFASVAPTVIGQSPVLLRGAEAMRSGLRSAVAGTGSDAQGLLPALVVGDTSAMPPLLTADLRDSGLAHLTAVSGANVAIVVGVGLLAARWIGIRGYALVWVGLVLVGWFVLLARPQPSVLRAAVMGSIALVAIGVAGRTQAVRSLLASVVALLLVDPWLSRSWGFALSVAATAGLVLLARRWSGRLPERWPHPVREATAVACAAQVATLPLVVALSGQVALLSVVANLLAAPAVAPATVFGAASAAVSPMLPSVAHWLAWLGQWPAAWIATVAHRTAAAPLATMPWPDGWAGGLLGLGCLVVAGAVWRVGSGRRWWRPRRVVVMLVVAVIVLAALVVGPGRWPPRGWVFVACDIGQGDALVVNLGDGAGLVVDAGPDPAMVDRCLDRLGIKQVPLLVLTHFHADHVDGLPGVLDGRRVESVLVSPLREPPEQVDMVASATQGMSVTEAVPGQTGQWGPAAWRVLWPSELITGEGSDANNASVVLLVEVSGVRLLLTGDVEPAAQQAMLRNGAVPRADVLKVPHHGSRFQDAEFLSAVGARVAVISVGEGNPYGHPAPELVESLSDAEMIVARTDTDGSVAVVVDGDDLRVVTLG